MGKRRGSREGTIFKRPDGRWAAVLDVGRGPDGRRRRVAFYGRTQREVQQKLTAALSEKQTGTYVVPEKISTGEYLLRWLSDYAAAAVRATTYVGYESAIKRHLVPELGGFELAKLQPMHLQRFYSRKLAEGLAPRTVRYLHVIIHEALKYAVKWGLVGRNVADAVEPPKVRRKEMRALTPAEAARLLAVAKDDRLYALYLLAVTTGMRQGELLGLRWQDLDLERATLSVRQALHRVSGKPVFEGPKTERSRRSIALPASVVAALRRHRTQQAREKLMLGQDYDDHGLVFCQPNGRPFDAKNLVQWRFKPLLRKAGLPDTRFHDLRHTCATLMLAEGVHPKIVSERLGHSTVTLTLDTYSHVLPDMQREAAEKLDALLSSVSPVGLRTSAAEPQHNINRV